RGVHERSGLCHRSKLFEFLLSTEIAFAGEYLATSEWYRTDRVFLSLPVNPITNSYFLCINSTASAPSSPPALKVSVSLSAASYWRPAATCSSTIAAARPRPAHWRLKRRRSADATLMR